MPTSGWLGPSALRTDQLLGRSGKNVPLADLAQEFLPAFLKDGARCTSDIWAAGNAEGLQRRTLQNASRSAEGLTREDNRTPQLSAGQELSCKRHGTRDDVAGTCIVVQHVKPVVPLWVVEYVEILVGDNCFTHVDVDAGIDHRCIEPSLGN